MENISDKSDSTSGSSGELSAEEYNDHKNELQAAVTRSGQTLSSSTLRQLSKALFINGIGASSCADSSSSVNTILLAPQTGSSGLVAPDDYSHFDGGILVFDKSDANDSTSVTVNFGQTGTELGAKTLYRTDGSVPAIGDVAGRCVIQWDNTNDYWVLLSNGSDAYHYDIDEDATVSPQFAKNIVRFDTSTADLTEALDDGLFFGQEVYFFVDGSGTVELSGTGLYENDVFLSELATCAKAVWADTDGAGTGGWRMTPGETAEWTGDADTDTVRTYANGLCEQTVQGTSSTGAAWSFSGSLSLEFAETFGTGNQEFWFGIDSNGGVSPSVYMSENTATSTFAFYVSGSSTSTTRAKCVLRGYYV
jgi:hypothetical protein